MNLRRSLSHAMESEDRMSKIILWLKAVLRLNFAERAAVEIDARRDALGLEVASRFGRGNITIQEGGILTKDELDREVRNLSNLNLNHR